MYQHIVSKYGTQAIVSEAKNNPPFLLDGLLRHNDTVVIAGLPKVGKSWLSAQLAFTLSEDIPFLEFKPTQKCRVLYFDFEMSAGYSAQRFLRFFSGPEMALQNVDLHRCADFDHVNVLSETDCSALDEVINLVGPDVIIFDTLSKMHFEDENSNVLMTKVMTAIKRLGEGRTNILVHHLNKSQAYGKQGASQIRGAGAILASVDAALVLSEPTSNKFVISCTTRHSPVEDIHLEKSGVRFVRVAKPDGRRKRGVSDGDLYSLFGNKDSLSSIQMWEVFQAVQPGVSLKTMQRGLDQLVLAGLLTKQLVGRHCVFSKVNASET